MTTRAGTQYLNRVWNVPQSDAPKYDRGESCGTTASLRAKLKRLTKAQLIDKLLFYMNNDKQSSNVQSSALSSSSISIPASASSAGNNKTSSNTAFYRSGRASLSGILIESLVPLLVEFLPGQAIHRLKCVSRELHKSFGPFASANFHRFRDQFSLAKYFNGLCSSGASLVEVVLDTSDFRTMVPETLLQQCRCDNLRSFKLWYRDDLLVPIRNGMVDIDTGKIIDSKGRVMDDREFSLKVFPPPPGKNVLQLMVDKCAVTLTELRIGLKGHSRQSKSDLLPSSIINLKNLVSLEVSMGNPLEVLDVVSKLGKLRRFAWTDTDHTGICYNPIDSVNYIIRSDSLEFVELCIGKGIILAGIECPNLRNIDMLPRAHGGGFCEFPFLDWHRGFIYLINDEVGRFVDYRAPVAHYVLTDTGYTPLQEATDHEQALYGCHFIQVNPTEANGNVSWLKVFSRIYLPAECTLQRKKF
eukprot:gene30964-40292_t